MSDELATSIGLTFIKNKEIENSKTTYRSIEVRNEGSLDLNHPFLSTLYKQYEGSISKLYDSFEEWRDSFKQVKIQVLILDDLKGDKVLDDRWERVVRFVQKHVS